MQRMISRLPHYAMLLSIVACASGASSNGGPAPERVTSPEMLSPGAMPRLTAPRTTSGRSPVDVTIDVMIDSSGRPDMTTFRATGPGANENQTVLRSWIEQATFRPAHRGDQPVPGLFRMKLDVKRVGVWRSSAPADRDAAD